MAKILLIEDGQYLAASIKEQLEIPSTAASIFFLFRTWWLFAKCVSTKKQSGSTNSRRWNFRQRVDFVVKRVFDI